jgi:hypothetical protein
MARYPEKEYEPGLLKWAQDGTLADSQHIDVALRALPIGRVAESVEEALALAKACVEVTHEDPEVIKAASAVAETACRAINQFGIHRYEEENSQILANIREKYYPDIDHCSLPLDDTCETCVPFILRNVFSPDTTLWPKKFRGNYWHDFDDRFYENFEVKFREIIAYGGRTSAVAALTFDLASTVWGINHNSDGIPEKLTSAAWQIMFNEDRIGYVRDILDRFPRRSWWRILDRNLLREHPGKYRHVISKFPELLDEKDNHSLKIYFNTGGLDSESFRIGFIDLGMFNDEKMKWLPGEITICQDAFNWLTLLILDKMPGFDQYDLVNVLKHRDVERLSSEAAKICNDLSSRKVTERLKKYFSYYIELTTLDENYKERNNRFHSPTVDDLGYCRYSFNDEEWAFIFAHKKKIIDFYGAFFWYCLDYMRGWDILNICGY